MINQNRLVPLIGVVLLSLLGSGVVFAQGQSADSNGHLYGVGQPKTTEDLPPGQLRKSLDALPAQAKSKAMGWLQRISFPAEDVKSLKVSADGSIHYADTFESGNEVALAGEATPNSFATDAAQVFHLHSKPGSSNVVYLDFNGHTLSGTAWSGSTLVALPFDPSENDDPPGVPNFTTEEINAIAEIWHRVAEDFATFDIDVTTEEPEVFTPTTGRILFTQHYDASGAAMPSNTSGGIAYVSVFGRSNYASYYSPALIYYTNLSNMRSGLLNYSGEVASHEFGHNLGLSHDGTTGGVTYYAGHGDGLVSWGPLMGFMLDKNITQWSKGEYAGANNIENDLAIIAGSLGYMVDDHGDNAAQATAILVESNGDILVSSPELDPDNVLPENKGIINERTDVDWFYIDMAEPGYLSIMATPAWHSFSRADARGANLDIELKLFNSNLELISLDNPDHNTNATVTTPVTTGRYFVQVDGVGNNTNSNYSDYASLGMYFLEGKFTAGPVDDTPPTPGVMSFQTAPYALDSSSISMTAMQATDDSGSVEYNFSCVAGGNGCRNSGWQSSRTWSPGGLDANTHYSFKVSARDAFRNENSASSAMGDTTDEPAPSDENRSPRAAASYNPAPAVISKGKTANVSLSGLDSSDPDGVIFEWEWKDSSGSTISTDMSFATKLREGTHNFTLTVTDDDGASNSTNLSVSVTKGLSDGGGGNVKPCNPKKKSCN